MGTEQNNVYLHDNLSNALLRRKLVFFTQLALNYIFKVKSAINQHQFKSWLSADQATNHNVDLDISHHMASFSLDELTRGDVINKLHIFKKVFAWLAYVLLAIRSHIKCDKVWALCGKGTGTCRAM